MSDPQPSDDALMEQILNNVVRIERHWPGFTVTFAAWLDRYVKGIEAGMPTVSEAALDGVELEWPASESRCHAPE